MTDRPRSAPGAPVIAIDGPSGSGKGTVAALVAGRLGWRLLDSGALYRVVAWAGLAREIPLDDADRLGAMTRALAIEQTPEAITVDGTNVGRAIREERIQP